MDGFRSCTPAGMIELMKRYNLPMAGKHAVVIGRSVILGKPMALLLLQENATVTVCHSRTDNLPEIIRQADILCACVGKEEHGHGRNAQARRGRSGCGLSKQPGRCGLRRRTFYCFGDHACTGRGRTDDNRHADAEHCHGSRTGSKLFAGGRAWPMTFDLSAYLSAHRSRVDDALDAFCHLPPSIRHACTKPCAIRSFAAASACARSSPWPPPKRWASLSTRSCRWPVPWNVSTHSR